jgi:hypothetical protein
MRKEAALLFTSSQFPNFSIYLHTTSNSRYEFKPQVSFSIIKLNFTFVIKQRKQKKRKRMKNNFSINFSFDQLYTHFVERKKKTGRIKNIDRCNLAES